MDAALKAGVETAGKAGPGHGPDGKPGHAQTFLALTALGVVFGDIGTSPLYAFSVALNAMGQAPGPTQVLGVVSLTFWALMLIVSLKYVAIVMRADNDGEGGILALLSLVEHHDGTAQRAKLSLVVLLGVVGAALLYGDGVITPAISVLSAIEGIKFSPEAANYVVPLTLIILIGLFALQYRGTCSVGQPGSLLSASSASSISGRRRRFSKRSTRSKRCVLRSPVRSRSFWCSAAFFWH